MKEDFLHYVWRFQKFDVSRLKTVNGEQLQILEVGLANKNAGPDFFNAKVRIDNQLWAGNVEIHIRSSDWFAHGHHLDKYYDNTILHVVWTHDKEIHRIDKSVIPTLVLQERVHNTMLKRYYSIFLSKQKWILCEDHFEKVDEFILQQWMQRLFFERLEKKTKFIRNNLNFSEIYWESLLFQMMCKNFGLKVNGTSFLSIAQSVDFKVFRKCARSRFQLEALLFGQAGLLDKQCKDQYFLSLQSEYRILKSLYNLNATGVIRPNYFRLRPYNFPTIRLSQFANLYHVISNLFSKVIKTKEPQFFYDLFNLAASSYWDDHFTFGHKSKFGKKSISKSFIDLLIINTIVPLQFCYAQFHNRDNLDDLDAMMNKIPLEDNTTIRKFNQLKKIASTAFHSQALLQLKEDYCDASKCVNCAVGSWILNRPSI